MACLDDGCCFVDGSLISLLSFVLWFLSFIFLKKNIFTPFQRKSHTKIYLFIYGQAFHMKKKKNKQTKICLHDFNYVYPCIFTKEKQNICHAYFRVL